MINFQNNNKSIIDYKNLQELLDEILTPKFQQIGLTKSTNFTWHEQTLKEIRLGFTYTQLKGASGTFTWGVNLDFIPTVNNNKIEYHKTVKNYLHHLFEWTDEYSNSFIGKPVTKGVTTHFGLKETKKSIMALFERNESKIFNWYEKAKSIENLIDIAEKQVNFGEYYEIHSPRAKYTLAFLYARANRINDALKLYDSFGMSYFDKNEGIKEKLRTVLLSLTEKNGM